MKDLFEVDDYENLNLNKSEIIYKAKDTILKQGSFISQVLFIKKGRVKIFIEGKNNRNTIIKIAHEGDFVALPSLFGVDIQPYTVSALSDSLICLIKKEYLLDVIYQKNNIYDLINKYVVADNLFLYNKINILNTRNNHGKLASTLLYLLDLAIDHDNNIDFISRRDLADLAGISLESVNKILLELKNDRIIDLNSKKIKIVKEDLLQVLSNIG